MRHRERNATQIGKPRFHLGIDQARIDFLVEPVDNLGGCVLGRADTKERAGLIGGDVS
jgi:hypothetical protein